jgi:hypothetical protein
MLRDEPEFNKCKLSQVKGNTTLNKIDLYEKATNQKKYRQLVSKYYCEYLFLLMVELEKIT